MNITKRICTPNCVVEHRVQELIEITTIYRITLAKTPKHPCTVEGFENFCCGFVQILIFHKPFSARTNINTSKYSSRSLRHQTTSTLLATLSSLFDLRNQSPCLLHEKTFERPLGANQLPSADSGLDIFKLACHWLAAIKENARC